MDKREKKYVAGLSLIFTAILSVVLFPHTKDVVAMEGQSLVVGEIIAVGNVKMAIGTCYMMKNSTERICYC